MQIRAEINDLTIHEPAHTRSSAAISIFFIRINRCIPAASLPHSAHFVGHYLPGETIFIREPAALHLLTAAGRELFPVIIDLLLRLAIDHERPPG
jgi:hypothetical protein